MTAFERFQKIVTKLRHRFTFIHPYATFKLQIEAAEIEVRCSDGCDGVIRDKGLGMDKALGVFVNFHARSNKLTIVGACCKVYDTLVPTERCYDPNVDSAFGGERKRPISCCRRR